jgi:hypothetical protein
MKGLKLHVVRCFLSVQARAGAGLCCGTVLVMSGSGSLDTDSRMEKHDLIASCIVNGEPLQVTNLKIERDTALSNNIHAACFRLPQR